MYQVTNAHWQVFYITAVLITQIASVKPTLNGEKQEVKVFQDDETPPEETLEMWTQEKTESEQDHHQQPSDVMNDLYCRISGGDNGLCSGPFCRADKKSKERLVSLCKSKGCGYECNKAKDWASCVRACGLRSRKRRSAGGYLSPLWTPRLGGSTSHLMAPRMATMSRGQLVHGKEKRYRLSLYDCIASYCGQLSGASRKSCIVYHCHRLRA